MKGMIDVCGGKITLETIIKEIKYHLLASSPKRLIVDIKRKKGGYYSIIYVNKDGGEK